MLLKNFQSRNKTIHEVTIYFSKDLPNCNGGQKHVSSFKTIDYLLLLFYQREN